MSENARESYATRLGFILGILGGAIGVGNVWRFSYMAGTNGGSAFFIPYVIAMVLIGIPAIMLELAYGRRFRGGPIDAHDRSGLPAGKQLGILVMCMGGIGFSYYMVLISWTMKYFFATFTADFWSAVPQEYFERHVREGSERFIFHFVTVALCALVALLGIRKGLEPVTKYMMMVFFLLVAGLAVYSLTLPGARQGLEFLFYPDFSKITATTWLMALGQIFYSIGVGGMVIITYGSYMPDEFDIPKTTILLVAGDTLVAVLCGIVIFPMVFTMGAEPAGGIGLVFFTLPSVFLGIPGGQFVGIVFFTGFFFAALSTGLFVMEYLSEPLIYVAKWGRRRSVLTVATGLWLLGIPWCYNMDWLRKFDLFNQVAARPLWFLLVPIAFLWFYSASKAREEVNKGSEFPVGRWWEPWSKYFLPIAVTAIYVWGLRGMLTH